MKIQEILGRRLNEFAVGPDWTRPLPHTSVGIEVEVEGDAGNANGLKYWTTVNDGSLQGGIEYVSEPVWGTAITGALEELGQQFKLYRPYASFRTSVHVHLNCLDLPVDALIHLLKLYLMYEIPLFRLHENRYNNIFCIPAAEAIGILKGYADCINMLEGDMHIPNGYIKTKYSALNINPLRQLGTIEFRHMGGTVDMNDIDKWIDIILQLKCAALLGEPLDSPEDVWGEYLPLLDIKPADLETGRRIINRLDIWR